jgi:PAS domain S-box-containing protein
MSRRLLALLAFVFLTLALSPTRTLSRTDDIRFRHISLDEGLSQGLVTCILQDERGFVWLGTQDGLNRYDGYSFNVYAHVPFDPKTLSHSTVNCLLEDDEGRLWVGTQGGLNLYSRDTDNFTSFEHYSGGEPSTADHVVTCLLQDSEGSYWVGTDHGLCRFDPVAGTFSHVEYAPEADIIDKYETVYSVFEDRSGRLWVGSQRGLFYFDRERDLVAPFTDNDGQGSSVDEDVRCFYEDRSGLLWIGWAWGLATYDIEAGRLDVPPQAFPDSCLRLPGYNVMSITEDNKGRLWFGSLQLGIWIADPSTGEIDRIVHDPFDPESPAHDGTKCVYRDRSDGIWLGTNGYGASVWHPYLQKFTLYRYDAHKTNSLPFKSTRGIYADETGSVWVGGYGGLARLDRESGIWTYITYNPLDPHGLPGGNVYTICDDSRSPGKALWIGTEGAGLTHIDRETLHITRYPYSANGSEGMAGRIVYAMYSEPSGTLWLGTETGLNRFNPETEEFTLVTRRDGGNQGVRAITVGRDGVLWVGMMERGLRRLDRTTGEWTEYRHSPEDPRSLSHDHVLSIFEASDGTIWAGTNGGGLNHLDRDTGSFDHFLEEDGLPNNVVYGILEDANSRLWLSTNRGLSRYDPSTEAFRNFDIHDGLQSNEFNAASFFGSASGEMFFGGIDGFNSFRPAALSADPHAPAVAITSLQIANRTVPIGKRPGGRRVLDKAITETDRITLSYDDDVVSFAYTALHFASPERNEYAYKLDGLDEDWHYVGNRRFVTFTDLRPGDYKLRVKAANADGVWNNEGTSIAIRVVPPLWGTLWFRIAAALVFVALLLGLHRLRTHYIRRRNRELDAVNMQLRDQIEERIRAENGLRESEEKYRVVAQSASEGIITIDESGTILLANDSLGRIFGYTTDELTGSKISKLVPMFPVGDRRSPGSESPGGGNDIAGETIATHGLHKNGEKRLLEISIGEYRTNKRRLFIAVIRDVTERKKLEEQFLQSQKMEAVGQLAGGIALDLNNLLTIIHGHSELAQSNLPMSDPVKKDIHQIMGASRRAESLTRQLLAFSRKQILQPRVINVNKLIENMSSMLDRAIGETIRLDLRLAPGAGNIMADPGQIEQVVMNLVVNARDAMPDGGVITIDTGNFESTGRDVESLEHGVKDGPYVRIDVSDTGTGMDAKTRAKMFEPFYTTKPAGSGTGLGLSTVYGIVKQSGGSVWGHGEPGLGSTFTVCLPRVDAAETARPRPVAYSPEGNETILVVEDEEGVRRLIAGILRKKGYEVLEAENGRRALEVFDHRGDSIDLILTDAVMPGMGGREFVRRISDRLGSTKVLYMSGYAEDMSSLGDDGEVPALFIHKPFTPAELMRRIRAALSRGAARRRRRL